MVIASVGCVQMRVSPTYEATQPSPSLRWEKNIVAFEAEDAANPPVPGAIVFAGSSSIVRWDGLKNDFPDRRIVKRGFGGSQTADLLHYADRVILPHKPSAVVVYEGDNDIGSGKSPETVAEDFAELVHRIHVEVPSCQILFIAIKPSTKRWNLVDQIREANRMIEEQCSGDPRLHYVDIFTPMLNAEGLPGSKFLVDDGLHMTRAGYEVWKQAVGETLALALD